jgi:tRNA-dihydrouridine synthase
MEQYAASGRYDTPTGAQRYELLSDYYQKIIATNQPDAIGKMKQFASWFTHGVGNGSELRKTVHAAKTPREALESVEKFFQRSIAAKVDGLSATGNISRVAAEEKTDRIAVA